MEMFTWLAFTALTRLQPNENELLKNTCGAPKLVKTGFISNGDPVPQNYTPFAVYLNVTVDKEYVNIVVQTSASGKRCSGVLISRRHVLTAAHCVYDESNLRSKPEDQCDPRNGGLPVYDIYTYIGSRCPNEGPCPADPNRTAYGARFVFPHPFYEPCTIANDLAIIELKRDVDPADGSPICIAEKFDHVLGKVAAVGYGVDTRPRPDKGNPGLQYVVLDAVSDDNGKITTRNKNKTTCFGDSGGPLYRNNRMARATLYGITSASERLSTTLLMCANIWAGFAISQQTARHGPPKTCRGSMCCQFESVNGSVCPRYGTEPEQVSHIAYDRLNREYITLGINYGDPIPEKERDPFILPRQDYGLVPRQRPGANHNSPSD
ncbi:trypsin [Ancylostoma duodenale]|uniref:Trypsin n=1 Tax=Ancylostoma duodenale TaxID=51022 RepID=A0A0C2FJ45_9BILA|nr:trypsin [Ancylostoma duodenale]